MAIWLGPIAICVEISLRGKAESDCNLACWNNSGKNGCEGGHMASLMLGLKYRKANMIRYFNLIRDLRCEIRDSGFEIRDLRFEIRDPRFETRIRDARGEVRDANSELRGASFEIRDPNSEI